MENFDQQKALPNLTKPAMYDPFSSSLRILSYQLRTMNLHVVADESLFWPVDGSIPSWPNLESINVMFHMSTPSGSWYFSGLPGVGATEGFDVTDESYPPLATIDRDFHDDSKVADLNWDYEYYRSQFWVEPNEETLVPFLTAFAKAAALMPSLKEFALWSPLQFNPPDLDAYEDFDPKQVSNYPDVDLAWGIAYTKPSEKAFMTFPGKDFSNNRQIWWKVAKWRPHPELHSLFQRIGLGKHGKNLIEYWGANDFGDGLNLREWFLDWEGERWLI
jgi:hypothetical protein